MLTPVFFRYQVERLFPNESRNLTNSQLSRWVEKKKLVRLRRELFLFPEVKIDELVLANFIYRPSYISLESALNYYGIIPDVVQNVTSISPVTTKTFKTSRGAFIYSKIAKELYFGWQTVKDSKSDLNFLIAEAEKALLDYIYIRRIRNLTDQRVDFGIIDRKKLIKYSRVFPSWVIKTINEQYNK